MTLDQTQVGAAVMIESVGGEHAFRRRLLELGLLPGTRVEVLRIAPLGDPLELTARGTNLSIRAKEAAHILVKPAEAATSRSGGAQASHTETD